MTEQDLKNSILQLAIQGKLVEQRADEGTAEELYQQIQAEKSQLIKDGKIKKSKALPEISKDEIPFDIPKNWKWVKLGNLAKNIHYGYTAAASLKGNCKLLRITDIQNNVVDWNNVPYCTVKESDYNTYSLNNRDILIARTGGTVGKSFIFPIITQKMIFASYLIRIVPCMEINEYYLKKFMESPLYWQQLKKYSMGTGQPNVNSTSLKNILLPLPPLAEQKRIVAKIEELMPYIEKYDKSHLKLEKLNKKFPEDMQKSILQYAIQGKLVEQRENEGTAEELYQQIQAEKAQLIKDGKIKKTKPLPEISKDEIPFDIPKNWKWVRLNNICVKIVDGDHNPPKGELIKTDYIMGSSLNINDDKLVELGNVRFLSKENFDKINARTLVKKGNILFTSVGTLGRSCIFKDNINITFQRSVTVIDTLIFNNYLKYYLDTPYIQIFINQNAKGTAQKGFYINQVNNLLVPLPPLVEQKRIVEAIEKALPYCKQLIK